MKGCRGSKDAEGQGCRGSRVQRVNRCRGSKGVEGQKVQRV